MLLALMTWRYDGRGGMARSLSQLCSGCRGSFESGRIIAPLEAGQSDGFAFAGMTVFARCPPAQSGDGNDKTGGHRAALHQRFSGPAFKQKLEPKLDSPPCDDIF